jgi:VanZ family protein
MKGWKAILSAWLPAIAMMMILSGISHIPGDDIASTPFLGADKLFHFSAYFILGFLLQFRGYIYSRIYKKTYGSLLLWPAFAVGALHGILDEIHQIYVPMRDFSCWDMLANVLGLLAGIYVAKKVLFRIGQ